MTSRTTQRVRQPTGNFWDGQSRGILLASLLLLPLCGVKQAQAQPIRLAPPRDMPYGARGIPEKGYYGTNHTAVGELPMPSRGAYGRGARTNSFLPAPDGAANGAYGSPQTRQRRGQTQVYQPSIRDYLSGSPAARAGRMGQSGTGQSVAQAVLEKERRDHPQPHNLTPAATRAGVLNPPRQTVQRLERAAPRARSPVRVQAPSAVPKAGSRVQQGTAAPPRSRWGQLPIPRSLENKREDGATVENSLAGEPRAQWRIEQSYPRASGSSLIAGSPAPPARGPVNTAPPPTRAQVVAPRALPVERQELRRAPRFYAAAPGRRAAAAPSTAIPAPRQAVPAPRPQDVPEQTRGLARAPESFQQSGPSSSQQAFATANANAGQGRGPRVTAVPSRAGGSEPPVAAAKDFAASSPSPTAGASSAPDSRDYGMLPAPRSAVAESRHEKSPRTSIAEVRTRFLPAPGSQREPQPEEPTPRASTTNAAQVAVTRSPAVEPQPRSGAGEETFAGTAEANRVAGADATERSRIEEPPQEVSDPARDAGELAEKNRANQQEPKETLGQEPEETEKPEPPKLDETKEPNDLTAQATAGGVPTFLRREQGQARHNRRHVVALEAEPRISPLRAILLAGLGPASSEVQAVGDENAPRISLSRSRPQELTDPAAARFRDGAASSGGAFSPSNSRPRSVAGSESGSSTNPNLLPPPSTRQFAGE